jgi:asparagine synthase (glutamine-hydrolysing)
MVRQISGYWRPAEPCALTSNSCLDTASDDGVLCALSHHTAGSFIAGSLIGEYRRRGVIGLHERTSDCGVVCYDAAPRTLILSRDRLGLTPLYYGEHQNCFAFGTRISDVLNALAGDAAPNRRALAALLVDGTALAHDQTCFSGISALPPGVTLIRHDGKNTLLPARDIFDRVESDIDDYRDAVSEFAPRFRAAVVARLDTQGPTAVSVSGGLDSAAIICVAAQAGDVVGINYGVTDAAGDESRYVDALRAAGLRIVDVPFYPSNDGEAIEQAARDSEAPVLDQVPLTLQRAARAAREAGAQTMMLGTWGDQVLAPFPPAHVTHTAPWRVVRHTQLAHAYQQYLSDVSVAHIQRAFVRQALAHRLPAAVRSLRYRMRRNRSIFDTLAREFPALPAELPRTYAAALRQNVTAPDQTDAIAGTTQWGLANHIDVRLPFLDVGLLQFLHGVPEGLVYHGHVLKPLLRDALRGVVPATVLNRRDKGDYTAAIRSGGPPVAASLERLDGLRRLVSHGLLSRASAEKTLARLHRASDIAPAPADLMLLLGVDAWLRIFF